MSQRPSRLCRILFAASHVQNVTYSCLKPGITVSQEASNAEAAFPTEEGLAAAERKKKGHIPVKRRKIIEQRFDDWGDNLAPLVLKPELSCFEGISSDAD